MYYSTPTFYLIFFSLCTGTFRAFSISKFHFCPILAYCAWPVCHILLHTIQLIVHTMCTQLQVMYNIDLSFVIIDFRLNLWINGCDGCCIRLGCPSVPTSKKFPHTSGVLHSVLKVKKLCNKICVHIAQVIVARLFQRQNSTYFEI